VPDRRLVVLVTEWIDPAGIEVLKSFASVVQLAQADEPTVRAAAPPAAAILTRVAPITAAVLDDAPDLRLVQKHGVGVDNIDVARATQRRVPVCYTPEANAVAVAEHAVTAALAAFKRLAFQDALVREGRWRDAMRPPVPELDGRIAGIIGGGRIGRRVLTTLVRGFGMHGLVHDPFIPDDTIRSWGAEPEALEGLLGRADLVSLHVPLTPATRHLINARTLALMRPTAVLVNTCRGPVVHEADLAQALRDGRIAGAAIDVFETEPPRGSPLLHAPNVMLSPHNAGLTRESNPRLAIHAAEEIRRVLHGEPPRWCLNPQVLAP